MNSTALTLPQHFGKHVRQLYTGGNWSDNCLQQHLQGLSFREATVQVGAANSIATLAFHLHHYLRGILHVLQGQDLDTRDTVSWQTPSFDSQAEWDSFVVQLLEEGEALATALEGLTEEQLWAPFYDPKYSSTFTNQLGILEHAYYHLGQIALLRKLAGAAVRD